VLAFVHVVLLDTKQILLGEETGMLLSWTEDVPLCPEEGKWYQFDDVAAEEARTFYGISCNEEGLITNM
jgi:hypothetical protein